MRQAGATLHRGARASHYRGLSCCEAQAPDAQAQQLWLTGLIALRHVGSSQTRAQTRVPCIGRQILNHCATREALGSSSFHGHFPQSPSSFYHYEVPKPQGNFPLISLNLSGNSHTKRQGPILRKHPLTLSQEFPQASNSVLFILSLSQ